MSEPPHTGVRIAYLRMTSPESHDDSAQRQIEAIHQVAAAAARKGQHRQKRSKGPELVVLTGGISRSN